MQNSPLILVKLPSADDNGDDDVFLSEELRDKDKENEVENRSFRSRKRSIKLLSPNGNVAAADDPMKMSPIRRKRRKSPPGFCVTTSDARKLLNSRPIDEIPGVKLLGQGGFGSVILGLYKGEKVAVKILKKSSFQTAAEKNALFLRHENVVRILKLVDGLIVMEFAGESNLRQIVESEPDFVRVNKCFSDVSSALEYIHSKDIIHLDVKPANIICGSGGIHKLGDFGCSRLIGDVPGSPPPGTSGFQAPELFRPESAPLTAKSDVFSFSMTMWSVLAKGGPLYGEMHPHAIIFQVVTRGLRPRLSGSKYDGLIESCWAQNPDNRPVMGQVRKRLRELSAQRRKSSSIRI